MLVQELVLDLPLVLAAACGATLPSLLRPAGCRLCCRFALPFACAHGWLPLAFHLM